jgi:hypothetical protein
MNSTLALTQGGQANTTGRTLEAVVTQTLEGKGLTVVSYRDYCKQSAIYGRELLLKNVPYESIGSVLILLDQVIFAQANS